MGKAQKAYSPQCITKVTAWQKQNLKQRAVLEALGRKELWEALPACYSLLSKGWKSARRKEQTIREANRRKIDKLQAELEKDRGRKRRAEAEPEAVPMTKHAKDARRQPALRVNHRHGLRSKDTAATDSTDGAESTCSDFEAPVPMRSCACRSCAPVHVRSALSSLAAGVVRERLLDCPASMPVIAMNCNPPRVEAMFNTKLCVHYSYVAPEAKRAPQYSLRKCAHCHDGNGSPGAECTETAGCPGCPHCVGRIFKCPTCNRAFRRLWAYETGSGAFVVGRDPANFEIRPFTTELDHALDSVRLPWSRSCDGVTGCSMVFYLGEDYCVACNLGLEHGTKECGSKLNPHQDRGKGVNSQARMANRTISVGDPRTLRMQLMLPGDDLEREAQPDRVEYELGPGKDFKLHPDDEESHARQLADGSVAMGSFYHSMPTPLRADLISCGFVFRELTNVRDVYVSTNMVILTQEEMRSYLNDPVPPKWRAKGYKTAAGAYDAVRAEWLKRAPEYAERVRQLVERALARWEQQGFKCSDVV